MNQSVLALGCSPLKSVSERDKVGYAKRKIKRMHEATKAKMAGALALSAEPLESPVKSECAKCSDLSELVMLLKEKCKISSRQKLRILTLAPPSWTIQKTAEEFNVSAYLVKRARDLKHASGILAMPTMKRERKLDESTVKAVIEFYKNDECAISLQTAAGVQFTESVLHEFVRERKILLQLSRVLVSWCMNKRDCFL